MTENSPPRVRGRKSRSVERFDSRSLFRADNSQRRLIRRRDSDNLTADNISNVFFGDFVPDRIYPVQPSFRDSNHVRVHSQHRDRIRGRATATITSSSNGTNIVLPSRFENNAGLSRPSARNGSQRSDAPIVPARRRPMNRMHTVDSTVSVISNNPPIETIEILDDSLEAHDNTVLMCPVCYESVRRNKPMMTFCGHVFCGKCINTAVIMHKKCPLCQKVLKLNEILPMYI